MSISQTTVQSHQINPRQHAHIGGSNRPRFASPDQDVRQEETVGDICRSIMEVRGLYRAFLQRYLRRLHGSRARDIMMVLQWDIDTSEDVLKELIWHRLGACILSLKLPNFEYFRHRFSSFTQRFPCLQDMFTDMGAEELRRSLDLATKQAEYQLDRQMDCHKSICAKETWDWIENRPHPDLDRRADDGRSCLFLYSLAVKQKDWSRTEAYRSDALRQYLTEPYAYSVTWQEILPENIYYDALAFFGVELPPALFRHQVDERDLTIAQ